MASIFQSNPTNYFSNSPTPGEITLMAGRPNYDVDTLDNALCQQVKECGFNAVGAQISYSKIRESIDNCFRNNLKLFVSNGTLNANPVVMVNDFKDIPGLGGWLLYFNANANDIIDERFINANNQIQSVNPKDEDGIYKFPVYIGFSGDWERDISNHEIELNNFIKDYQDSFKPSMWPVMYFPDLIPADGTSTTSERVFKFFKTLQYMQYVSRYTATPFWYVCRCQAFSNYYGMKGTKPSLEKLRGSIFTALAYGAQGIYYWNYRENPYGGGNQPVYSDAPIDINGNKTETWDLVRQLNREVKAFNNVFCGCDVVDCRLACTTSDFDFIRKFEYPVGPLMNISIQGGVLDDQKLILVSHLNKDGKDYLVLVNNSSLSLPVTSIPPVLVTPQFNSYWNIYQLMNTGETYQEAKITNYGGMYPMKPGDYLIFRWE